MNVSKSKLVVILFAVIIIAGISASAVIGQKQDKQYAQNDDIYVAAEAANKQGQFDVALQYINTLLKDDPTNEKLNRLGASAAFDSRQFDIAAKYYQAALDRNPHNVEKPLFLFNLAISYFETNQIERAKVIFTYLQEKQFNPKEMPEFQDTVADYLQKINK